MHRLRRCRGGGKAPCRSTGCRTDKGPSDTGPREATRGGVNAPALPVQRGRESPLWINRLRPDEVVSAGGERREIERRRERRTDQNVDRRRHGRTLGQPRRLEAV